MVNYKNGLIYTIRTGDCLYVGSTCNFNRRKQHHKEAIYNQKNKKNNLNLYKKIRENDGEWDMKPHKEFPCENNIQLIIEEEKNRVELNADLNMNSCYNFEKKDMTKYQKDYYNTNKVYFKERYEKNKESINNKRYTMLICECGCEISSNNLNKHKKTAKHIKLMETQN